MLRKLKNSEVMRTMQVFAEKVTYCIIAVYQKYCVRKKMKARSVERKIGY